MTKTQYYTATTIDGYIADPDNSLEWLFQVEGEDGAQDRFGPFFAQVGAMAMGATTYQWVVDHEKLLESPEKWQEWYSGTPCWVFTHHDLPVLEGADIRFVADDVRGVHEQMAAAAGEKNIWVVGGGELAGQFADAGLLDELLVSVAPATLGAGAPLLPRRLGPDRLRLTGVEREGQFVHLAFELRRP